MTGKQHPYLVGPEVRAALAQGGTVLLPAGTYVLSAPLVMGAGAVLAGEQP